MKITLRKIFFYALVSSIVALLSSCAQKPQATSAPETEVVRERLEVNSQAMAHFMDGQLYFSQGDYAMAVIEFQDALAIDSTVGAIHVSLAESFWHLGKRERAEWELKQALRLDPDDIEAKEMLGHQYVMRQQYKDAEVVYAELWKKYPDEIDYGYTLANLAKVQEKFQHALEIYLKIHEHFPDKIAPLENAAQIALGTQKIELAQKLFDDLARLAPDNADYLKTLSDITILNGDYEAGISLLEKLIENDPDDIDMQVRLGTLYYENSHKESAYNLFAKLYERGEISALILYFLSTIAAESNDLEKSIEFAQVAIEKFPDEPRGYGNLALAELQKKKPYVAIDILQDAAIKIPGDFTLNFLLGNSYHQVKNYPQAEKYLEQALTIFPESAHARQTLALIYDTTQNWAKSDSLYELLVKTDDADAQSLNNYAYSLAERNVNLDKALEMSHKAIELEPKNSAYLDTVGWIYFKLKNLKKAQKYIQSAVNYDNTNAVVLEHLGDVLSSRKLFKEANKYYRQAAELEPGNERLQSKADID